MLRRTVLAGLAALALGAGETRAQSYPERPITIVVAFPERGGLDIITRLIAGKLQPSLGQPVTVQNVPGEAGSLGANRVAKADPDGYTLLMTGDASLVTNVVLNDRLPYDPRRDFAPISRIVAAPNFLLVPASSQAKSLDDLLSQAKSTPDGLAYAHSGTGTSGHLAGEMLRARAGVPLRPVLVPNAAEIATALNEGRAALGFVNIATAITQVKEGRVRALAVTAPQRSSAAPDVPTVAELGHSGFDATAWFALLAPANTPQPVVTKLHAEVTRVLRDPDVSKRAYDLGYQIIASSPDELAAHIRSEIPRIAQVAEGLKGSK